ncbi:SNF2 family domain-containing protein [Loa loa]|uniref:SWI/SNF-related matrix-associated actin-dependent regulator of chromatin subfamily A containing DEAD/H box 1 homolog n=1 Tax=Loa loa TaxID=7209 RepID=A0A1I7VTV3_LOALO|nr:SNF2 family domain-containing protein [Loa loa]EFO23163.2 SNF2 family domain-containing protein [Loa loa]
MSAAGSFGTITGERRRVAHRPNESVKDVIRGLAFKKQSVAQMVNLLASRTGKKDNRAQLQHGSKEVKKTRSFYRSRRLMSSSEEEELIENESNDEDLKILETPHTATGWRKQNSDTEVDEDKKETSKAPSRSFRAIPNIMQKDLTFEERLQTLTDSESSDQKTDAKVKWLCKPRLNGFLKQDDVHITTQPTARRKGRKRAVISSSSDEKSESNEERVPVSLKMMVKRAKKHKKYVNSSSEESDEYYDSDSSAQVGRSDSNSENGQVMERRSRRNTPSSMVLKNCCVTFFNEANRNMLMGTPRINDKVADFIMSNRPFRDYEDLESRLLQCPRGSCVAEQYLDFLENRSILENILDDCRRHSEEIYSALESIKSKQLQMKPKLLSEECELHPYQQIGLNWLVMMHKLKLNAILADEMGLGKTIQVIAFITYLKSEQIKGPHLIVVPSSTIENWLSEFSKWSPKVNLITYYGSIADRRQLRHMATDKNIDVFLTTYNMVGSKAEDRKFFKRFRINYVIYDEGHLLKNCNTDRYRNLMKIHGERKILITGTPLQNNLVELISLMYFTMTKLFTKYCDDIGQLLQQFQQKIPALEAKNGALYEADKIEQAKAILKPYILRRLKADVLSYLPKKKDRVIKCPMITEQKEIYTDLIREFRLLESNGEKYISSPLMQLRQVANHPLLYRRLYNDDKVIQIAKILCAKENEYRKKKSDHVAEDLAFLSDFAISQLCSKFTSTQKFILNEEVALESGKFKELDKLLPSIKEKGDKVLIFSQFTSVMDILEVYLKLRDHQYCRLDGSTPVMERQDVINEYNSSPDLFVFLLSTKAGGLGINLTAANHIILHDIDFNPYNDKQAEGRCHRMGQTKDVFVVRLISADTVEEEMLALAQKKLELEKEVTGTSAAENSEMENLIVEKLLKKALAL